MFNLSKRAQLCATTALVAFVNMTHGAYAQQTDDEDILGTIVLGESKREVQTDTAVPSTVVDQEEIEDRQAGTVAELIDTVPGVTLVNGSTAAGSGINIRGYGANSTFGTDQKVLIQIDGATKGSEELYRIGTQLYTDPYLYKQVEVLRGTIGSFEYGSGVFGGVVLLETIDASDLTGGEIGFTGRQTLEFTSNGNGVSSSTTLAWQPSTDLEFLINYTRRMLDTREDGNGVDINPLAGDINDPSYLLKAKYTFGANRDQSVTFSYAKTQQEQFDVPYDTFGTTAFGNVDRLIENEVATLRYNFDPADRDWLNLTAELTYSDELVLSEAVAGPNPLLDADNRYQTTTFRIKNTALFSTGAIDHELRTGVEFIHRKRQDETAGSAPGGTKETVALFVVDEMQIGERWTITPALRYENQTITEDPANGTARFDKDGLMGGISARYAFADGWAVFGSAAYTENLPIVDDINNAALINQSERGSTYEIGVSFDRADVFAGGDQLAFKLNYYSTRLWDLTTYRSFAPGGSTVSIEREGIELEAAYAMANGFYMDANAHISNGQATIETGAVSDWAQNPQDTLRLTLGKKFSDELDVSWEIEAAKRYDEGGTVSPGYGVHNLRATYAPQQGVLRGTEIRIGIENVMDKAYQPRLSTRNATGRNFKVSLSKTF
ncbi:TonB-dependent heme receptor A [Ascidiaceihabitans donghaensis]|uniref:TonB-dependent heme receptor A n=1 Tax=Ascidiaceihabitans donghaensis TaxID=1510460 RepID=A0A2R8BDF3_9RHOB|nr:TonB-dependent receptor [Ascidiaceihabitans donghaensis]SPH21085.1 TonB-dependent heme receptor A [Ascidiaceihabitans donghaensis]